MIFIPKSVDASAAHPEDHPGIHFHHVDCGCCRLLSPHDLFKDKVFGPEQWQRHVSWRRHIPDVFVAMQILAWYWPPVLFIAVVGVSVGLYHSFGEVHGAPCVTCGDYTAPFTLTSFALSLLLVFRTNSSYDRWWEARKMWGTLLNITRNLVRQSLAWSAKEDGELREAIVRWTIAMPYAMKAHCWKKRRMQRDLEDVLLPHELDWLHQQPHFPTAVTQVLTEAVRLLHMPDYQRVTVDQQIVRYNENIAAVERLYSQPLPIAYLRHTSRFLMTWLLFLPFAIFKTFQWFTPGVCAVVAFLLLGVENISVQIENPFAVLPLAAFCAIHKANLRHMPGCRTEALQLLTGGLPAAKPVQARMAQHPSCDEGARGMAGDLPQEGQDGLKARSPSSRRQEPPASALEQRNGADGQQPNGYARDTVIQLPLASAGRTEES